MHEVIICEKPKSAERIAQSISNNVKKHKYNKKVSYWEIEENDKKITVVSAVGHLYSLTPVNPKDKVYFDLKWVPIYEIDKSKKYTKDYVNAIKKLTKNADKYIHACDFDTEGTLIGYNALQYACGKDALEKSSRMKFSTLTKPDIVNAYNNTIDIDLNQVESGIARHILDYYFGVNISKYLMQTVRDAKRKFLKLSVGRVQTPALSLVVDREKKIKEFVPEPYWVLKAKLKNDIIAEHNKGKINDKKEAEEILNKCKNQDALVDNVKITEKIRKPPVPFNLGGLQSEAYSVFKFSPKKTQTIAQNLYTAGYTSYPRTSSQKLPESLDYKKILGDLSSYSEFRKHISKLPKTLKPNEGKKTDEAHPAIHPTGTIPEGLTKDEKKIYELIVYRFISVFSEDSKLETMRADLLISNEKFNFKCKKVSHLGWLEHYKQFRKLEDDEFPNIKEGDIIGVKKIISEEKETKPPARYNEASLMKALEKKELGTKATRADIIKKLYDRKYIKGQKIEVNQLGENLIDTLKEYCKDLTSEELTRDFEQRLEGIDTSKSTQKEIVDDAEKEVKAILNDVKKNNIEIGTKLYEAYQLSNIVGDCSCGGKLVKLYSPRNKSNFVGCTNFPDCNVTYSLPADKNLNFLKKKCEKCGLPIISYGKNKEGKRIHACLDPDCGKDKAKRKPVEIVGTCPECGKKLIKRSGRYGEFIGCKGFPGCKFTCNVDELEGILKKKTEEKSE